MRTVGRTVGEPPLSGGMVRRMGWWGRRSFLERNTLERASGCRVANRAIPKRSCQYVVRT